MPFLAGLNKIFKRIVKMAKKLLCGINRIKEEAGEGG